MRKALAPIENYFRQFFPKRIKNYKEISKLFYGEAGIEIGGPSQIFTKKGFLPLYKKFKSLDNVNFSNNTVWEGRLQDNSPFEIENARGIQYIKEATELSGIEDSRYSFLLSSHTLEHIANPIKAILEWKRVIKVNGYLLLILPNKLGTFDIKRDYTTLEHLLDDFKYNVTEEDTTHINEIITLHDHSRNPTDITVKEFNNLINNNYATRCAHHHVFDRKLIEGLLNYVELDLISIQFFSSIHIVILAKKLK